jgi:dolichol kinase
MEQKPMRHKSEMQLEFIRKMVHILVGILIVLGFNSRILDVQIFGIIILLLAAAILYNLRAERELLTNVLSINRADATIPGIEIFFYLIGCFIVLLLFPLNIASASIMILAFGDAIAHLASKNFSGSLVSKKTYAEGTIFGTIAGTLAAWTYVPLLAAIIAATCAMLVEAGDLRIANHRVDDNLLIPLVAGTVLWLLQFAIPSMFL